MQRSCRAIESIPVSDRTEIAKMPQFHRLTPISTIERSVRNKASLPIAQNLIYLIVGSAQEQILDCHGCDDEASSIGGTTDHEDHKIALTRPYIFIMLRTADSCPQLSKHRHSSWCRCSAEEILRIFQNRYAGGVLRVKALGKDWSTAKLSKL